jgi:hypothetical protein
MASEFPNCFRTARIARIFKTYVASKGDRDDSRVQSSTATKMGKTLAAVPAVGAAERLMAYTDIFRVGKV